MLHRAARRTILLSIFCADALAPSLACAQAAAPVIESVTIREDDSGRYQTIYPEFHFHDPSGNVVYIHRELVATNAPRQLNVNDGVIKISASRQMQGTIYVGGWPCGPETYYVTLRAFMMNLDGVKSNAVEYTIHCNGG